MVIVFVSTTIPECWVVISINEEEEEEKIGRYVIVDNGRREDGVHFDMMIPYKNLAM